MKFVAAELKKILTGRFLGFLAVALAANFLLFWHNQTADRWSYTLQAQYAAQKDVLAMDEAERYDYVQERVRMLNACREWVSYDTNVQNGHTSSEVTEEMLRYREVYESGSYLKYTDSLQFERTLMKDILDELQRIRDYRQTMQNVIREAELKTTFSIYSQSGTFAYRSQLAVAERMEKLLHIQPVYDVSEGVLNAQSSAPTDLLALVLILYICVEIIVTEQKNGMLPILRATRKGRLPLILSKLAAVFVLTFAIACAFWGSNLAFAGGMFGFGDLSRPVQSLRGFSTCTLEISVGGYLVLFFLLKWLAYAAVGILGMALGLAMQNTVPVWLGMGGFLCAEYVLTQTVSPISAWNLFRYVNISNLIFDLDWMSQYRNLDIFGFPVDVLTVSCILLAAILALGILCVCLLFCGRRTPVPRQRVLRLRWPRWLGRPGRSTVLFGHELWKLLIECGTLVVLVLFAALNLQEPYTVTLSTEDLYYKNYMQILAGPMDFEKEALLQAEEQRFAEIRRQLAQLERDHAQGKLTDDDLTILQQPLKRSLEAEKVLIERVYPRISAVRALITQGKQAWMVYEPGYEYLFGLSGYQDKAASSALLVAGIILSFANIYPLEATTGMQPLLNVYIKGRNGTTRNKIAICMLLTTLLFAIAQIPDYWYLIKNYGFPVWNAPICSLPGFEGWSGSVSILGGIVSFEGLRLMAALTLGILVMMVCQWTRSQLTALCITTGIFLLPMLLHLLGVEYLDAFSLFRPLTGTGLLCSANPLPLSLLYYGLTAGLGCAGVGRILHRARLGCASRRTNKRKSRDSFRRKR